MTPLELIQSLKNELKQYGEKLAVFFPERVKRFSDPKFTKFWGINVNKLKVRLRKGSNITSKSLEKLKERVTLLLGENKLSCLKLIKKVEKGDLAPLEFIESVRRELGRYSNSITVQNEELSTILFKNPKYIRFLTQCLNNPNHPQYNPNLTFSRRKLNNFKEKLFQILGICAQKCIGLIEKYSLTNPNLPEYSHQQYTIEKPHIFDNIDTVEKSYWLGFFCADACLHIRPSNKYQISLEISSKDKAELYKLAEFIGFDKTRIKDRVRLVKLSYGRKSFSKMSLLRFVCFPMGKALIKNGKFGSNSLDSEKKVPDIIRSYLNIAFQKSLHLREVQERKIGLAWLLGYFDGDGTVYYDRKGKKFSGEIISSSKTLLDNIKFVYKIKNKIGFKDINQGTYRLAIGPEIYKEMMSVYSKSMQRKRPD